MCRSGFRLETFDAPAGQGRGMRLCARLKEEHGTNQLQKGSQWFEPQAPRNVSNVLSGPLNSHLLSIPLVLD